MNIKPHAMRHLTVVALVALCAGPLAVSRVGWAAGPPISVNVTRNFYPPEVWQPGKQRQWMSNGGEIELRNTGAPVEMNLRFVAESFQRVRQLKVVAGDAVAMIVVIPPAASRYVVVKHLRIPSGKTTVRFEASPGPARPSEVATSSDTRELSVAFGPFSLVDSAGPEALIEQTGAFPEGDWRIPTGRVWDEERAQDLRRQGRLAEARVKYQAVIATNKVSELSYLWAGLCALILGAPDEAQRLFRSNRAGTTDAAARGYAAQISAALDEFVTKSELIRRPDPVSRLRTSGEIYLAVPEYAAALRANPDDAVANFWLGAIYVAAERAGDARLRFERIVQAYPNTYEGQFLRNAIRSAAP